MRQPQLGSDGLPDGGVRCRCRCRCLLWDVGQSQLCCVDYLDFGYVDGDDDVALGDGGLLRERQDPMILYTISISPPAHNRTSLHHATA